MGDQVDQLPVPPLEEVLPKPILNSILDGLHCQKGSEPSSIKLSLATKPGDNYSSILYAVELEFEAGNGPKHDNIMLKTIPKQNEMQKEFIFENESFKKEAIVYQQVFQTLTKFQKERGLPDHLIYSAWPQCYAVRSEGDEDDYLAMENLRPLGYLMGDRKLGLDFNHTSVALQNLAKFHALSYCKFGGDLKQILAQFPILEHGMFQKDTKVSELGAQFVIQALKSQADMLRAGGDLQGASWLAKLAEVDFLQIFTDLVEKDVKVPVICHGDYWVNNLLFKYENNDLRFPARLKFIDMETTVASSRFIDIFYFLLTSVQMDALQKRETDLLMIYYAEFTSFCGVLGVDTEARGLSWEAFLEESEKYRLYGVLMGLVTAPMFAMDSEEMPDMDKIFTKEKMENSIGDSFKEFYGQIKQESVAVRKVSRIVREHLVRCKGATKYYS